MVLREPFLRLIPLGGLGEVGMNCMILEYKDTRIMIDCGVMFPDQEYGVNLIAPDFSYIYDKKLDAIILTHAHDDHIGATPFLLREIEPPPIMSDKFTLGLLREKLKEAGVLHIADLRYISPNNPIKIGDFKIIPFRVSHSTAQTMGLVIKTDRHTIVHTSDYKLGYRTKEDGITDLEEIKRIAKRKIDLLLADSTNIEERGRAGSEKKLKEYLFNIIKRHPGRVFISLFSTSIPRIQGILDIAKELGRYVVLVGRSMQTSVSVATSLGLLRYPSSLMRTPEQASQLDKRKVLFIISGTQGEPNSSLKRLSQNQLRKIKIEEDDLIILSSKFIPGNELSIYRMISDLCRLGAKVLHQNLDPNVHVSGHAYRDEQREVLESLNPRFFIPVHGNYHYLKLHEELAHSVGIKNTLVMENGDVVGFDGAELSKIGKVPSGKMHIDGLTGIEDIVLQDRMNLAESGVVTAVLIVDVDRGELMIEPQLITRGVVFEDANRQLLDSASKSLKRAYENSHINLRKDPEQIKQLAQKTLRKFFLKELARKPVALVMVIPVTTI